MSDEKLVDKKPEESPKKILPSPLKTERNPLDTKPTPKQVEEPELRVTKGTIIGGLMA